MATGFTDPGAGRYRGEDDAAAKAFRELQRNLERLREDPLIKIIATTPIVGTYKAIPMGGRTTADGVSAPGIHWGMRTEPVSRAYTVVNTLESATNSASLIRIGTVLVGSRRMNANGQDTVFVSYTPSSNDYIDTDPDGVGGGPGINPGGIPPDDTTGGPGGACPSVKKVVIAGAPVSNGTYFCTWNPTLSAFGDMGWWVSPGVDDVDPVVYLGKHSAVTDRWAVWCDFLTIQDAFFRTEDSTSPCPPNGSYPLIHGFSPGDTSPSCVVSD